MRRRIQYWESQLAPIKTPKTLCVIEADFYGTIYPVVLAIWDNAVFCLDILENTNTETYVNFFRMLEADLIKTVCIDPEENLLGAVSDCFPMATVAITEECILRYARNAMLEIIHLNGKRFPLRNKNNQLTLHKKYITNDRDKKQIEDGMKSRERLKIAYDYHQRLLELSDTKLSYETFAAWIKEGPEDLTEFAVLTDIAEIYEAELKECLDGETQLPKAYATSVKAICEAFKDMPRCIFDVLRARSIFTKKFDTIEEDGEKRRLGIRVDLLTANMNEIAKNIREEREYGLER